MSLEERLAENTAAIQAHTKALNAFLKAGGGAASSGGSTASTGTKPAGTTKPKGPTLEDIQAKFGDYMSITDKQVRAQRKEHVLAIAGKFGADRATNIDPKHFKEALDLLAQYEAGEDPLADDNGDGDEGGDSPI